MILIVDGYNVIHAWPSLKRTLTRRGLEDARRELIHALSEYSAHTAVQVTVVFDARTRRDGVSEEVIDGVRVRFGSRAQSADHVIERLANEAARRGDAASVTVATGDRLQRDLVAAMGVSTTSAASLAVEVGRAAEGAAQGARRRRGEADAARAVEQHLDSGTRRRLERMRRGRPSSQG